jgi:hypothetical protein
MKTYKTFMHLSMLTPTEGGSGKGWGFDIFTKKNGKCHSLGRKSLGKIPHPRDEILFLKYLVSGALQTFQPLKHPNLEIPTIYLKKP